MGVRAGLAEDASLAPAAQASLPGEEAAAELARALAQIAQEDPDGAASLGASLGLRGAVPAVSPAAAPGRPSGFGSPERLVGSLLLEPSEDFDVDVTLTVAVVGSRAVGKTELVRHFARGRYSEDYQKSIATEFVERRKSLQTEEEEVTFHIWDCPGSDDPASFAQTGCRRAQAYLIVFSTDDRASFEKVQDWLVAIRRVHGPEVLLVLAQTKCDLAGAGHAGPSQEEVEALVHRLNLVLCISSARNGVGTTETFECLGTELLRRARCAEELFRAGMARGGLQWESAPPGGSAAVWAEAASPDDAAAAACDTAASSNSGAAEPLRTSAEARMAVEADADEADEDVGLLLPGL